MIKKDKNKIEIDGGILDLEKSTCFSHLIIKGDVIINSFDFNNALNLKIELKKHSTCKFNIFKVVNSFDSNLDLIMDNNSKIDVNLAFISNNKFCLNIDTKLYGDNITSSINIRGINEINSNVKIIMNGTVAGETHGNILNEHAKIINKSEQQNILIPNLIINTNDVTANHGVSIDTIDLNSIFYLNSKGIDKFNAIKLLEEGFILAIFNADEKEKLKKILTGR